MLFKRRPRQVFDLVVEEPAPGESLRRLQRFAGFVQSDAPVPALRVRLHGNEQAIVRTDLGDPAAPPDRRHTAYWNFHLEIPANWAHGDVALEVHVEDRPIARRSFRHAPPDDRGDRPLVLMMHIPKTAGTSLRLALENQPLLRLLRVYDDPEFLSNGRVAGLSPASFDDLDVVFGHFPYGLHRVTRRRCRYTTILRHPADVLKSGYLFNKYLVDTEAFRRFATIDEAVAALGEGVDNVMTRFVSGKTTPGRVSDIDLATAIVNIERDFAYVGTVEDMETTLRALGDHLGVSLPSYAVNQTPKSSEGETIARDDLMARFGRCLEYDMRLYERAQALFRDGLRA